MTEVKIRHEELEEARGRGADAYIGVLSGAVVASAGGSLTLESMSGLSSSQIALVAYATMREEVLCGGFIQLIHNGYGGFIFLNPFAKVLKQWGLRDLSRMIYDVHTLYVRYGEEIERDCTDEAFMALYERFPEFDDADDTFVDNEEEYTSMAARYVEEHIEDFATVI